MPRLISDSLQRIRHASSADIIRSIVASTTAILDAHRRDDLSIRFNEDLRDAMTEWQTLHGNTSIALPTTVTGDNFTEENMDVDDDQEEKQKKQQSISSASRSGRVPKDVDYRFVDQEADQPTKPRRKSRFSDLLPTDLDRLKKSKMYTEKPFHKNKDEKSMRRNPVLSSNRTRTASPEIIEVSD